jgi:DoxX-like family
MAKTAVPGMGYFAICQDPENNVFAERTIVGMGFVLLVCVVLYLVPRTSVLGAILLTGYLGAVATHVRVGDPLFTHRLFPVFLGVLLWGGLFLRDSTLRTLIPLRRSAG